MLSGLDDGTEPAGIASPSDRKLRLISQDAFAKYCMAKASCGSTVEVSPDSIDDGEHHCERPEPIPDYAPTGAAAGNVYARVDYVPEQGRLLVTMSTIEPTVYQRLRAGLAAMFVVDDPDGPPTLLVIDVDADLRGELPWLLGDRLVRVARAVIGGEPRSKLVQLDIDEVAALAEHWAPYRAEVLAGARTDEANDGVRERIGALVGTWADGLWTRIGGLELLRAVAAIAAGSAWPVGERSAVDEPDEHGWRAETVPERLADRAGIEPTMAWRVGFTSSGRRSMTVRVRSVVDSEQGLELFASFDHGADRWVRFRTGDERREWIAVLGIRPGQDESPVRLSTRGFGDE